MPPTLPNQYHFIQPALKNSKSTSLLIFLITGNPGLVAYYGTFLSHLYSLLSTSPFLLSKNASFEVFSPSLKGFEVGAHIDQHRKGVGDENIRSPPYGLQDQIEAIEASVKRLVNDKRGNGNGVTNVILMGHSVGSYILLEILRRHRVRLAEWKTGQVGEPDDGLRIVGGICLFPTVTHIKSSRTGRKVSWLLQKSWFALIASSVIKLLCFWIPISILSGIVQFVTRLPPEAAAITAAFLESANGVRESLHMARDEMNMISEDAWDAEIWGAAQASPSGFPRPKLFFLFGKDDHWVSNETRNDLIKIRAGEENWRPRMEIDEVENWPHAFSIRHGVAVAERVKGYVENIVLAATTE